MDGGLTPQQQRFLNHRKPLAKIYPWLAGILLSLTAVTLTALVLTSPLLFNPYYVMGRIKAGTLCLATTQLMAGMLPVMSLVCLFAVAALVTVMVSALGLERKYLAIVQALEKTAETPATESPEEQ